MVSRRIDTVPNSGPMKYVLTDVKYRINVRKGRKFEPTIGSLKPSEPLRLNVGPYSPYSLDYEVFAPKELAFARLGKLGVNHLGKKIYSGKDVAIGLIDDAKFSR